MKLIHIVCLFLIGIFITSCYKDKGNYTYTEANEITIEGIPDVITVLTNVDTLRLSPKITSKFDGEILDGNPNYSFVYAEDGTIKDGQMNFKALDSSYRKDLDYFVKLDPKNYEMRFVVTDKRTGVQTIKKFQLRASTPVSEGWMILSNEGSEKRVRMDMVSIISEERIVVAYDILPMLRMPETTDAKKIWLLYPSPNQRLGILAGGKSYTLEAYNLNSGPSYDMQYLYGDRSYEPNPKAITSNGSWVATVDQHNNAFAVSFAVAGPMFGFPVNNLSGNRMTEFEVSDQVAGDPRLSGQSNSILFYDITNKRFMSWSSGHSTFMRPITNPESSLFDYNTGKNMVYMEASRYGNGTAYSILESGGKYFLYGIQFVAANPVGRFEQSYYAELNIPDFEKASCFAFHSTLPYMFYSIENRIYQFDIVTKQVKLMQTLASENVTMLKFQLFKDRYSGPPFGSGKTQEYLDQQYDLIVGSSHTGEPEHSRGRLRFYSVPPLNGDISLIKEYSGFADIVDVTYREAR